MRRLQIIAVTILAFGGLALTGCTDHHGLNLAPVDNAGVPVDRGEKECKTEAFNNAGAVAKGDTANGIADDFYLDCLVRRGYLKG
jgi:hypothetical protein